MALMGRALATDLVLCNRFWQQVLLSQEEDGCWVWQGACAKSGYGVLNWQRKVRTTHRIAWEFWFGPIPEGLHVLHRCDNRPCVRPDHLFLGTNLDNIHDRMSKGRKSGFGAMDSKNQREIASMGGKAAWKIRRRDRRSQTSASVLLSESVIDLLVSACA